MPTILDNITGHLEENQYQLILKSENIVCLWGKLMWHVKVIIWCRPELGLGKCITCLWFNLCIYYLWQAICICPGQQSILCVKTSINSEWPHVHSTHCMVEHSHWRWQGWCVWCCSWTCAWGARLWSPPELSATPPSPPPCCNTQTHIESAVLVLIWNKFEEDALLIEIFMEMRSISRCKS